jgi:hypothetical protein
MSKQLPNKSNKKMGICPKMGPQIHRNHRNYVICPLHFLKKVCPILRHARVVCTETLPNFLHHWRRRSSSPGRNVFHVCPCYKEQDMHQWHQHVQRHATLCCIVSTQNTSWDLLRFAFSTGSSSFVLKKMSFSQQFVFDIFALENGWKRCLRTKRSCENRKFGTKQSENLHGCC